MNPAITLVFALNKYLQKHFATCFFAHSYAAKYLLKCANDAELKDAIGEIERLIQQGYLRVVFGNRHAFNVLILHFPPLIKKINHNKREAFV